MALASSQASLWSWSQLPVGAWGVNGTLSEKVAVVVVVADGFGEEVLVITEDVVFWV